MTQMRRSATEVIKPRKGKFTRSSTNPDLDAPLAAFGRRRSSFDISIPQLDGGGLCLASLAELATVHEDATPRGAQRNIRGLVRRASVSKIEIVDKEAEPPKPYVMTGIISIVTGVLSVIPYNLILESDPGSPFFIAFCTHIFFVLINITKMKTILFDRKIPAKYHAGFVALGFLFNTLKADASVRLPASLCMLLLNLQLLVAMVVQRCVFGTKYSLPQISGVVFVTAGVIVGGRAQKQARELAMAAAAAASAVGNTTSTVTAAPAMDSSGSANTLIGVAEMLAAITALTLLSTLVKVAFARYGESVDEQMVMQHLGALPLFVVGGQWPAIVSRLRSWGTGSNMWLMLMLVSNMAISFAGQATQVQFAGRAPNLLIVQLAETLKKFLSLLTTAMLAAPPFPPLGFWLGSTMLVTGTVQFLTASDCPTAQKSKEEEDEDKFGESSDSDEDKKEQ